MNLRFIYILMLVTNITFAQTKFIERKYNGNGTEKGYLDSDGLKTGLWQRFYSNGKISEEQNYIKEKKDGTGKEFYNNGQLILIKKYKNGNLDGKLLSYYVNGTIKSEEEYKNGGKIGTYKDYFENATISKIEKFDKQGRSNFLRQYDQNGRLSVVKDIDNNGNGIYEATNDNGVVRVREIYKDHHRISEKDFYDSGIIKKENQYGYENGNNNRWLEKKYDKTGKLREERLLYPVEEEYRKVFGDSINEIYHYEKNTGSSKYKTGYFESYYFNGQIAEQGYYKKDFKDGVWKTFYNDGKIKFIGKFISKNPQLKDSTHTYYYPNGQIEKVEFYKAEESKKVKSVWHTSHIGIWKSYYQNGNSKEVTDLGEGTDSNNLHGKYLSYYENGKLELEATYNNKSLIGPSKSYYQNGNLKEYATNHTLGLKNGLVKMYYENGILASEIDYYLGKKDGKAIEYFENGNIKNSGVYESGNNKTGEWSYYYQLSAKKLAQKIVYTEDGKIVKLFYPNGNKMAEITTRNENPDYKDISVFNPSGKKVSFNEFASLGKDFKIKDYVLLYSDNAYVIDVEFGFENSDKIKVFKKTFQ